MRGVDQSWGYSTRDVECCAALAGSSLPTCVALALRRALKAAAVTLCRRRGATHKLRHNGSNFIQNMGGSGGGLVGDGCSDLLSPPSHGPWQQRQW